MTSLKDKNLLFYSIHPNDEHSREFLKELEKYPSLKKQFILVCVNDPNIRIPEKIKQIGKVPVIIVSGFNRPIFGQDAISWLKNGSFQELANGFEYGSLSGNDLKCAFLGDECKTSDYNQFFNNDYNRGFVNREGTINQQFASLAGDSHVTTYAENTEMKKDLSGQLEQRLSMLKQMRDTDVPKPVKRIGGMEDMGSGNRNMGGGGGDGNFYNLPGQNGGGQGGSGCAPTYNPNPFGQHGMPSAVPQLPFSMPSRRQGGNGGNGAPPLPFSMPMMPGGGNGNGNGNGGRSGGGPQLPFAMGARNYL
jgi:hypothetical protein|uniref:Uncharacterized protein n=1 Tax=viral metagenome TaxID=1070528 RepID=A0A6C0BJY6_9ZZZZ